MAESWYVAHDEVLWEQAVVPWREGEGVVLPERGKEVAGKLDPESIPVLIDTIAEFLEADLPVDLYSRVFSFSLQLEIYFLQINTSILPMMRRFLEIPKIDDEISPRIAYVDASLALLFRLLQVLSEYVIGILTRPCRIFTVYPKPEGEALAASTHLSDSSPKLPLVLTAKQRVQSLLHGLRQYVTEASVRISFSFFYLSSFLIRQRVARK